MSRKQLYDKNDVPGRRISRIDADFWGNLVIQFHDGDFIVFHVVSGYEAGDERMEVCTYSYVEEYPKDAQKVGIISDEQAEQMKREKAKRLAELRRAQEIGSLRRLLAKYPEEIK